MASQRLSDLTGTDPSNLSGERSAPRSTLRSRLRRTLAAALFAPLSIATTAGFANAATSGANGTHDPSRMIESDGLFYVYSTGGGSKTSPDGLVWTNGSGIFAGGGIPSTTTSVVSNNEGVWAPDVVFFNGQYYIYYSIANAQNACAVGLLTTPTLNPKASNYKLTDRGLVVSNTGSATYCTIDPAPLVDATGNLWLAWGSGYSHPSTSNTIWVTRLDNTTGLASATDAKPGHALEQGHIEASYIHYHSGYYYLFWNSGGCCDGASSSYLIHVARSQTVTGPYTGTKNFYGSTGSIHGPGHIGVYEACGASRFTYHYYPDTGQSVLGENELSWGSDGWPVVGAESTTPLKPCGATSGGTGGAGGGTSVDGQAGASGALGALGGSDSGGAAGSGSVVAGGDATGGAGEPADAAGGPTSGGSAGGDLSGSDGGSSVTGNNAAGSGTVASAAGSTGTSASSTASGCSCTVRGKSDSNHTLLSLIAFGAVLAGLRRRRRAASPAGNT